MVLPYPDHAFDVAVMRLVIFLEAGRDDGVREPTRANDRDHVKMIATLLSSPPSVSLGAVATDRGPRASAASERERGYPR
jgi:hypothetical protein